MSKIPDKVMLAIQYQEAKRENRIMPPEVVDYITKHGEDSLIGIVEDSRAKLGFPSNKEKRKMNEQAARDIKKWLKNHNPYSCATALYLHDLHEKGITNKTIRLAAGKTQAYVEERSRMKNDYKQYLELIGPDSRSPKTLGQFFWDKYTQGASVKRMCAWSGLRREVLISTMQTATKRYTAIVTETVPIPLTATAEGVKTIEDGKITPISTISNKSLKDQIHKLLRDMNIYIQHGNLHIIREQHFGNAAAIKIEIVPGWRTS